MKIVENEKKETFALGKYATLALKHLKENKKTTYLQLLLTEELNSYLSNIDKQAQELSETIYNRLDGMPEFQKSNNFLQNCRLEEEKKQIVENTILTELVYP